MVCRVNDAETYYWEGEQCLKCEGEKTNGIIASAVVIALGILLGILKRLGIVAKVTKAVTEAARRRFPDSFKRYERYKEKVGDITLKFQTKYKILVTFTQVLSKVTVLYPINLPTVFSDVWHTIDALNPFILDLNTLPISCIMTNDFHR